MSFAGFSEDDIRKLKNDEPIKTNNEKENSLKNSNLKNGAIRNKNEAKIQQILHSKNQNIVETVPQEAVLNKGENKTDDLVVEKERNEVIAYNNESNKNEAQNVAQAEKKSVDLDEFQARQKLMEEQNRKRKELLAKALADRTKQTQEEAERLNAIQSEFKKLDAILSNDVKILRKQIEAASLEYMEAQKKYHKIEKEFLDAKLLLHQRLERKEMLTEHLCAIIEKNEERKADKLMELLKKLNMNVQEEPEDATKESA